MKENIRASFLQGHSNVSAIMRFTYKASVRKERFDSTKRNDYISYQGLVSPKRRKLFGPEFIVSYCKL